MDIEKVVDPVTFFYEKAVPFCETERTAYTPFFIRELSVSPRDFLFTRLVKEYGPDANNIEAFDHWVLNILPKQVMAKIVNDVKGMYHFSNVRLLKPTTKEGTPLFPAMARKCGLTYSGALMADLCHTPHFTEENAEQSGFKIRNKVIGNIPVMLGSVSCHLRGYSGAERRAVFEDEDDPLGTFIIKGSERIIVNQETLAIAQQISKASYEDKESPETRVTNQGISGSTVVSATIGRRWPVVKVVIYHTGMKATASRPEYPIFAMMDALFQCLEPETFAYENIMNDPDFSISAAEISKRRKLVMEKSEELINFFVPAKSRDNVKHFLAASRAKYASIKAPINFIVTKRKENSVTTMSNIAQNALLASSRRAAAAVMTAKNTGDKTAIKAAETAAAEAAAAVAAAAVDNSTASAKNRNYIVLHELLNDLFSVVDMNEKAIHLARLVAQHVLVAIGERPLDNRDGWENKRIKLAADWMSQLLNGCFRVVVNKSSNMLVVDAILTEMFVNSFNPAAAAVRKGKKENVVHMVKRDTPIALASQVGRINVDAPRRNKQANLRLVQPSQLGYCCPAETSSGEACGLTKNMACTTRIALRRDTTDFIDTILKPVIASFSGGISTRDEVDRPYPILIDNRIYGWCNESLTKPLKKAAKTHMDFYDICVVFNKTDFILEIYVSGTRPVRPLFTVDEEAGQLVIDSQLPPDAYYWPIPKLIESGAIEFVHATEQQYLRLVEKPELVKAVCEERKHIREANEGKELLELYSEIDPLAILGVAAALMPQPNTCQGPRVNYQAGMATQSLGLYHDSYTRRLDKKIKRIESSRPTFESRVAKVVGGNRMPTGRMFLVAYVGLATNGEDGIVFQKESLERTRITKYTTHRVVIKLPPTTSASVKQQQGAAASSASPTFTNVIIEKLARPVEASEEAVGTPKYILYKNIEETGLPRLGSVITKGSCILGRVRTVYGSDGIGHTTNASIFAGVGEEGVVDTVDVVKVESVDNLIVRIRVRQTWPIITGDKLASRYSQKGTIAGLRSVISSDSMRVDSAMSETNTAIKNIGPKNVAAVGEAIVRASYTTPTIEDTEAEFTDARFAKDLPRIASGPNKGITPDCFINPLGMPSRMTIGMLYEMLASKAALYSGERVDGSAFRNFTTDIIEKYKATLMEHGLDPDGYETLEHSDGTPFRNGVKVFVAPCFYQFLRHTVSDKIQFRSKGSVLPLTHQPVQGRSKEGGLRQGEMEKTAMCSWGASDLVRERLMLASDKFLYEICATCGTQVNLNHLTNTRRCKVCPPDKEAIGIVETPYIHILVSRMVNALGIQPKFTNLRKTIRPHDI